MISYQLAWEIISVLHLAELFFRRHTEKNARSDFIPGLGRQERCGSSRGQVSTVDGSTQSSETFQLAKPLQRIPASPVLLHFHSLPTMGTSFSFPALSLVVITSVSFQKSLLMPHRSRAGDAQLVLLKRLPGRVRTEKLSLCWLLFNSFISSHKKKTI